MSAAETLRRAASQMREKAENATQGRWHHVAEVGIAAGFNSWTLATTHHLRGLDESYADAEHIAGWHPAVALAVADWLDKQAADLDTVDAGVGTVTDEWRAANDAAVTFARTYLGEVDA